MSVELVRKYFENTELEGKVLEFDVSTATVELAAAAVGTEPDRIAKTMAFLIGKEAIVVLCPACPESTTESSKISSTAKRK